MSKNKLRKILFFIWPPYEAYVADVTTRDETHQDSLIRMKKIKNDINSRIPENISGLKIIENESKDLYDSEIQRKEILESKATEFTAGFGLAISILSIFPILIGDNWGASEFVKIILGIIYLLGIAHLMFAVVYSIKVRQVEGIAIFSSAELIKELNEKNTTVRDRIISYVSKVKFNETILTKKVNHLAVAETMFLRGLVLIIITVVIGGVSLVFVSKSNAKVGCVVPNLVGLEQAAAINLINEIGLNPIISKVYDGNHPYGNIISQNPSENTVFKPCDSDISIVISLGKIPTPQPTPTTLSTLTILPTQTISPQPQLPSP